jgi:hypothetical protein
VEWERAVGSKTFGPLMSMSWKAKRHFEDSSESQPVELTPRWICLDGVISMPRFVLRVNHRHTETHL